MEPLLTKFRMGLVFALLVLGTCRSQATAQDTDRPLTIDDLLVLLEGDLPDADIIQQLIARKMEHSAFTPDMLERLQQKKASPRVIAFFIARIADQCQVRGEWDSAIAYYRQASELVPAEPFFFLVLTRAIMSMGNLELSLQECDRAIEKFPDDPRFLEAREDLLMGLCRYSEVPAVAEAFIKLAPNSPEGYLTLAVVLSSAPDPQLRNGEKALELARLALERSPTDRGRALLIISFCLAELQRFDEALKIIEELQKIAAEAQQPFLVTLSERYKQRKPWRLASANDSSETSTGSGTGNTDTQSKPPPANLIEQLQRKMVRLEGGKFTMGSDRLKLDFPEEAPAHDVEVAPFWMSQFEVTNREFAFVMLGTDENVLNPDQPVEGVSWDDAQEFLRKLNQIVGANLFRLPTEAEWEFAARAGTTEEYFFGATEEQLGQFAWFSENSQGGTQNVGRLKENPAKLFDMYGNVAEWCQDQYSLYGTENAGSSGVRGSIHVFRGGSWANSAQYCRSAARGISPPDERRKGVGFRLAANAELTKTENTKAGQQAGTQDSLDSRIDSLRQSLAAGNANEETATNYVVLLRLRARIRFYQQRYDAAIQDLTTAFESTGRADIRSAMLADKGLMLAFCPDEQQRKLADAIEVTRLACSISHWEETYPLLALAGVFAANSQFENAVSRQRDALSVSAPGDRERIQQILTRYEKQELPAVEEILPPPKS